MHKPRSLLPALTLAGLLLLLQACATSSSPSKPATPPAPSAAMLSSESVTNWQAFSKEVENYLREARESVTNLLNARKGCNATAPKSAACL